MTADRPPKKGRRSVFLDDFVDVGCPFAAVRDRLCSDGAWLAPLASRATDDGAVHLRVGPAAGGPVRTEVQIRLGRCVAIGSASVVPIRWEATKLPALFPVLDGNLTLTASGEGDCRLGLQASYRPPFDAVGRLLDFALLHKVAQSTIRSFLTQVARSLEEETSDPIGLAASPGDEGVDGAASS